MQNIDAIVISITHPLVHEMTQYQLRKLLKFLVDLWDKLMHHTQFDGGVLDYKD